MEIYHKASIPEHIREAMGKAELSGKHRLAWQIRTEFQPGFKRPEEYARESDLPADVRLLLSLADARVRYAARRFKKIGRAQLAKIEEALNIRLEREIEAEVIRSEYNLKSKYPSARKAVEERKRSAQ